MKKTSMILVVFVMVLTMTQCKKNEATDQNETVTITLDVKHNNGAKVDVNPATGTVDFETGDKVYVGSGGKYVGILTHNGTNFVGNITNPTEGQPLQFYFLGNVTPNETLSAGTTEECSVIISDQTENLPVISCASSFENYVSGVTAYTGHLLNKCALVKFNVTTPSNSPICITGMKNKVTVDFSQNTVTPSMDGEGVIKLPAGSGENVEKWAILLPQESIGEGEEGSAYSEDGLFFGIRPAVFAIVENGYSADGTSVYVNSRIFPEGAINGLFTINENGDQVYFSQGNLQFQASTNLWRFAENQWDFIGEDNTNISPTYNGWIDLFGWGTSGWNNGNIYYHPSDYEYLDPEIGYEYGYGYGPTDSNSYVFDLAGSYSNADWGVYNAIINGGNQNNEWRTLTATEWYYICNSRGGVCYMKACVNSINGLILLPDNWNNGIYPFYGYNSVYGHYSDNVISALDWLVLEQNGAVFLPAGGNRKETNISWAGTIGDYWSASNGVSSDGVAPGIANQMRFANINLLFNSTTKYYGLSVRLVHDN